MKEKIFSTKNLDVILDFGQVAFYVYAITSGSESAKNVLPFIIGLNFATALFMLSLLLIVVISVGIGVKIDTSGLFHPSPRRTYLIFFLNVIIAIWLASQASYLNASFLAAAQFIAMVGLSVKDSIIESEAAK
jgi:hypothetical protein